MNPSPFVRQMQRLFAYNHATEHRSQMTPVLYRLGHGTESLDYARFVREAASQ